MIILVLVEMKRRIVVAYILGQCYFYRFFIVICKRIYCLPCLVFNRLTEEMKDNGGGEVDNFFGAIRFGDDALGLVPIKIVDGRVGDDEIVGRPPDESPQITRRRNGWHMIIKDT
jgi:hypothetical protein